MTIDGEHNNATQCTCIHCFAKSDVDSIDNPIRYHRENIRPFIFILSS